MKLYSKIIIGILLIFFTGGCVKESDSLVKKKLLLILQDDLESIIKDISKEGVADSTYFKITEYNDYKESAYTKKAVVDFFFFRKIKAKIVRKYRYDAVARKWERYFNEYKFYDIVKKH
jgi:hypothetical protein